MFNPSLQIKYCRDIERVHFGKAPRLNLICEVFGRNTAESWLIIQLNDLAMFSGCKEKLSPSQIEETAQIIVETYPTLNLTELMLFFQRFKRCEYGKFYGAVDPMIILQALSEFAKERDRAFEQRRKRQKEALANKGLQEYEELKQRYKRRVPGAFTPAAPINFLQYRLMGFDAMTDSQLQTELEELRSGRKTIPAEASAMLTTLANAFNLPS